MVTDTRLICSGFKMGAPASPRAVLNFETGIRSAPGAVHVCAIKGSRYTLPTGTRAHRFEIRYKLVGKIILTQRVARMALRTVGSQSKYRNDFAHQLK